MGDGLQLYLNGPANYEHQQQPATTKIGHGQDDSPRRRPVLSSCAGLPRAGGQALRMRAVILASQADAGHPLIHKSSILVQVVTKPFAMEKLARRIKEMIGERQ